MSHEQPATTRGHIVDTIQTHLHWLTAPRVLRQYTKGLSPLIPGQTPDPVLDIVHQSKLGMRATADYLSLPVAGLIDDAPMDIDAVRHAAQLYRSTGGRRSVRKYFVAHALPRHMDEIQTTLNAEYPHQFARIHDYLQTATSAKEALRRVKKMQSQQDPAEYTNLEELLLLVDGYIRAAQFVKPEAGFLPRSRIRDEARNYAFYQMNEVS